MFPILTYDEVSPEVQAIFDQYKKSIGRVPNMQATIANSGNALTSYMNFRAAQAKNTFHGKDREGIYLIVSQLNGCNYCLAAHTQEALKFGWKEEETILLRSGKLQDPKWQTIYHLIQAIIGNKGEVSDSILNEFFALGYSKGALMDLMIHINIMSFTNYVYALTKIPIDYPLSKPI